MQPKSGALAAAMMAATVAGGSGFLDARKGIQEESSRPYLLRSKKSKVVLTQQIHEAEIAPLPTSTLTSSASTMVSVPSKLTDSVTMNDSQEESNATVSKDRKCFCYF